MSEGDFDALVQSLGTGNTAETSRQAYTNKAVIDQAERSVLTILANAHPLLTKNVEIEVAAHLSKQKVCEVVTALIDKGLATRPQGERKGVVLTAEGLALVDRIRKSSTDHP